jgi:enoyl-[acyl-carrier-protein] reductase (NADH)
VPVAPREALDGDFVAATTRENFKIAHDISSYSFTEHLAQDFYSYSKPAPYLIRGRSNRHITSYATIVTTGKMTSQDCQSF